MGDTKALLNATSNSQYINSLLSQLPRERWMGGFELYQWQGQWFTPARLEATIAFQSHFQAHDDDVIITCNPKTGSTWLKSLVTCIIDQDVSDDNDPLLTNRPHVLIPTLECQTYKDNPSPDFSSIPSPRIFSSHLFYKLLPESIKMSKCKMVYLTRNPKDTFVSLWHFLNTVRSEEQGTFPLEEAFESFCNGVHTFGPFFDHVLEYWKESLKQPEKILFLKYEDLKSNPREEVKRLASFLGRPFVNDEEVDKVLQRCSIDRLKNLEVNKNGVDSWAALPHSAFFRRGVVGDWKNSLTPEMSERINQITRSKLEGSGLDLEI